jgi:hypothetical protein
LLTLTCTCTLLPWLLFTFCSLLTYSVSSHCQD